MGDHPTQIPCTTQRSGQGHGGDGQMHRELQGTRILKSSSATLHRQ